MRLPQQLGLKVAIPASPAAIRISLAKRLQTLEKVLATPQVHLLKNRLPAEQPLIKAQQMVLKIVLKRVEASRLRSVRPEQVQ
jgi:hypothetical protein